MELASRDSLSGRRHTLVVAARLRRTGDHTHPGALRGRGARDHAGGQPDRLRRRASRRLAGRRCDPAVDRRPVARGGRARDARPRPPLRRRPDRGRARRRRGLRDLGGLHSWRPRRGGGPDGAADRSPVDLRADDRGSHGFWPARARWPAGSATRGYGDRDVHRDPRPAHGGRLRALRDQLVRAAGQARRPQRGTGGAPPIWGSAWAPRRSSSTPPAADAG